MNNSHNKTDHMKSETIHRESAQPGVLIGVEDQGAPWSNTGAPFHQKVKINLKFDFYGISMGRKLTIFSEWYNFINFAT